MMEYNYGMEGIYWIVPNRLAGRPGPNRIPWDPPALKEAGFTLVLSLSERMFGKSEEFYDLGIAHVCLPLPKAAPPNPGDREDIQVLLPHLCEIIRDELASSSHAKVLMHCSSGKDRSALVMLYYLTRDLGMPLKEAYLRVKAQRSDLLTARGWYEMTEKIFGEALQ